MGVRLLSLAHLMFDTHCHLNFSRFKKNVDEVIRRAKNADVTQIVIPGTDIESSKKAIEIAEKHEGLYGAVGIHPHHAFQITSYELSGEARSRFARRVTNLVTEIEKLLSHSKVIAVGEIGIDRHVYENTKYEQYVVDEHFLAIQRELFAKQIHLAIKHRKSLIIHNREATDDVLKILADNWDTKLVGRAVFHCCEPSERLLSFAKEHNMFIGVDGDITYDQKKQEFIKRVPLEMLVLETDSPYLLPEPLRSRKEYLWRSQIPLRGTNEPKNVIIIADVISKLLNLSCEVIAKKTTENAQRLFVM